jgi:hypothetical protein
MPNAWTGSQGRPSVHLWGNWGIPLTQVAPPRAALVDEMRRHVLADAGLARDDHFCVRAGRSFDVIAERANGGAVPDQLQARAGVCSVHG